MNVIDYCAEEVRRQGHDISNLDGIERVGWMLDAWSYALSRVSDMPSLADSIAIGKLIERHKNKKGIRTVGVRVGPNICPHPKELRGLLDELFEPVVEVIKPLDFYRAFELIHPFEDGNGRTGKVLLNWLSGTLLTPFFPPNYFWGPEIRNP